MPIRTKSIDFAEHISQNSKYSYDQKDVTRLFYATLHLANESRVSLKRVDGEMDTLQITYP